MRLCQRKSAYLSNLDRVLDSVHLPLFVDLVNPVGVLHLEKRVKCKRVKKRKEKSVV